MDSYASDADQRLTDVHEQRLWVYFEFFRYVFRSQLIALFLW